MARDSPLELSILGRRLRVTGAGRLLERWIRRQWEFPDPLANACAGDIAVDVVAEPPTVAAAASKVESWVTRLDGCTLTWQRDGERGWRSPVRSGGVQLMLDGRGGRIRASGTHVASNGGDERDDVSRARRTNTWQRDSVFTALHVAICEALRATGLAPLHASVIARDGHATALVGPSGAGKSTTLIRALDSARLVLGSGSIACPPQFWTATPISRPESGRLPYM